MVQKRPLMEEKEKESSSYKKKLKITKESWLKKKTSFLQK
jgi:hypothetical protein